MKVRVKINGRDVSREQLRASVDPEILRDMLESGVPPMSNTDREFLEGRCNGNQFERNPGLGDHYARVARRHGVDSKGKVYLSGLASFPGDPRAWVDGRGDVAKVCDERGWGCVGSVNRPVTKVVEPTGGGVAPDLIDEKAVPLAENTGVPLAEAREQVREMIKPHWVK